MASIPVIAFDIAPMDLIIDDGENGAIVKSKKDFDVKEYAKAMLRLAEDGALRKKMGQSAYEKSFEYGMDKYVAKWDALFAELEEVAHALG